MGGQGAAESGVGVSLVGPTLPRVSARSGRVFSPLFQSNSPMEILPRLLLAGWMAMAEDERASGVGLT